MMPKGKLTRLCALGWSYKFVFAMCLVMCYDYITMTDEVQIKKIISDRRLKIVQLFEPCEFFWPYLVSPYYSVAFCIAMMGSEN